MTNKNKLLFTIILLSLLLASCDTPNPLPTATAASTSRPSPTVTIISTLTLAPTSTPTLPPTPTYFPTFTPPSTATSSLPQGWKLDEYATGYAFPEGNYDDFMGIYYEKYSFDWDSQFQTGFGPILDSAMINDQPIRAFENITTTSMGETTNIKIMVTTDEAVVFSIDCDPKKSTYWERIISFWTFDNHWVLELFCEDRQDVILDGQSLNTTNGYSESFSPYLISGKLFFFFKRDGKVGFYYDGYDYLTDYENVLYHYCCGIAWYNPEFYKDQVHFCAVRGGEGNEYTDRYNFRYDVVMGILDLP